MGRNKGEKFRLLFYFWFSGSDLQREHVLYRWIRLTMTVVWLYGLAKIGDIIYGAMLILGCMYHLSSWAAVALEAASKPGVWEPVLSSSHGFTCCGRDWRAAMVCAVAQGKAVV
ncbi:hypothetical protein LY78DRAFT_128371 [Colletotrichum sublineola]|nr:hypothetical protein LY78DRAFT_128371 [Colletotrichum sublineola]